MFFMNAADDLTLKNRFYKEAVRHYVEGAYEQDTAEGDLTSRFFLEKPRETREADLTLGETSIFAGLQEARWLLSRLGIQINYAKEDGAAVVAGDIVMKLSGSAEAILKAERTLLNLLQRMSGVAGKTAEMRKKLPMNIHLLATRKTLWGPLDKRAVVMGGGASHRLHLGDAVLIKDNHLELNADLKEGLSRVFKKSGKWRFVEVELESEKAVHDFISLYREVRPKSAKIKAVVMLDNMSPTAVGRLAPLLQKKGLFVEVSGGITEKNIHRYVLPGVHAISSGALTGQAHNLDISLHFR